MPVWLVSAAAGLVAGLLVGWLHGDWRVTRIERDALQRIAEAIQQLDELAGRLRVADMQLLQEQAKEAEIRERVVYREKVKYRDRIQTVTVRDCVADSGILQLYNAAHGLPTTAE